MVPLHACRVGEVQARAGIYVSMELPQTAAGVSAPGVDPASDELESIKNYECIVAWLGASTALKDGLLLALGGVHEELECGS